MGYILQYALDLKRKRAEQDYERQQKELDMRASLEDRGLAPQEASAAAADWVKSGKWNVPTSRTKPGTMEPGPDGLMAYGPPQPVTEPISLRKQEDYEVPYVVGEDGRVTKPQIDEGLMGKLSSQGFRAKPKFEVQKKPEQSTGGYDILVDADGNEVNRYPNMTPKNTTRVLPRPAGSGKEDMDPQQKAAYKTLEEYDQMLAKGEINAEFEQRAVSAAKLVGLPTEKIVNKPGFFGRLFGKEDQSYERPTYTQGAQPPAKATAAVTPELKQRATQLLKTNGHKVTDRNIQFAIQNGWVK